MESMGAVLRRSVMNNIDEFEVQPVVIISDNEGGIDVDVAYIEVAVEERNADYVDVQDESTPDTVGGRDEGGIDAVGGADK
jgi:hypothetical protein